MKIKKLLKNSFIFFSPFILILFILFCINILIKDFNFAHKAYNIDAKSMNWVSYLYSLNKKKLNNYFENFYKKKEEGLPRVEINISEKSLNALLSDIPSSSKKYVSADFKINNIQQKVRLRYMGDNPANWFFHQKAIRVKTRKSETINRKRYFEYKVSQRRILDDYVAYIFAKKLDLLVSDVRLVELIINNKSSGIFIERERYNESFLRRNKIMPVNFYKGEASRNSENKIGLSENLDENPGLWEKIAILNSVELEDYSDLELFTNKVRKASNSYDDLKSLLKYGNDELFAKIAILEILLNWKINDSTHNRRLILDVWSGKKYIVPHDFHYNRVKITEKNLGKDFNLDTCYTRLFCILNQSSEFLNLKYDLLYKIVKDEKVFEEVIEHLENIKSKFLISQKRDFGTIIRKNVQSRTFLGNENSESFDNLIKNLKERKENIIKVLEKDANSFWKKNKKGFEIIVDKSIPISNLIFKFEKDIPKWIVFDYNNNNLVDPDDIYFYPDKNQNFNISLKLFANRILTYEEMLYPTAEIYTSKTGFGFFAENNLIPSNFISLNNFTGKQIQIKKTNYKSNYPTIHNKVIYKISKNPKVLSGNINLKSDLFINDEIKISEGTVFILEEGVSIVFENKVSAIGSIENPIIFKKKSDSNNWGTIALIGNKTDGSIFKNIIFENGSGKSIDGINYFSSLSIHSAKNIVFDNILVKDNSKYDDMMHIIYSKDIKVLNSEFLNAHLDSIDVDVSKNISFKNSAIINSGNDGIDFMESTANLEQIKIISSGDKGISVGENSNINIKNSKFENNKFALASKDASKAIIENSVFGENEIQLSTYKKNWRYGDSGLIEIKNSNFTSLKNELISDETGKIEIISSDFNGKISKRGNVKIN